MPRQQTLVFDDLEAGSLYKVTLTDGAEFQIYYSDFTRMPAGKHDKAYYCLRGVEPTPDRENKERAIMFPTDDIMAVSRL